MNTKLPIINLTQRQMEHVKDVKVKTKKSMAQYVRDLIDADIAKGELK